MMIKYPIHKVAKDFKHGSKELPSKEVMDILTQYGHPPKNHMQPLTEQELSIVFEYLTQHNQVESIASIYEDVYHEPAKPAAQQAKQAPAAHQKGGASKQPTHSQQPAAPKGGKQAPVQQQGRAGGVLPEGGEHIPQGGEVFALDQGPHPLHLPLLQLHPGGHIPEEAGVAQLHMEP